MQKILSTIVATAVLSTGAFALDFIDGKYYGGVGMGIEDFSYYSSYDPGVTLVVNGGKPIVKLGPGTIGAETEFTYTIVPMSYARRYYSDSELTVMTLGAYATYTYDLSQQLYARAKLGVVARDYSYNNSYHSSRNRAGEAAGIGAGYKFNENMRVFSDLIMIDGSNLKQMNFGLQLNF